MFQQFRRRQFGQFQQQPCQFGLERRIEQLQFGDQSYFVELQFAELEQFQQRSEQQFELSFLKFEFESQIFQEFGVCVEQP